MNTPETLTQGRRIPKWVAPTLGYGISLASLIWVFSHFPFAEMAGHLKHLNWGWVALAVAVEVAVYFADAWRWMVLLKRTGAPSLGSCAQAVFVGVFANDILPARAGEVIRCFLLSFKTDVPLSIAITSDCIARLMDGLWIVILYVAVTAQVANHTGLNRVMWLIALGVGAISAVLLWVLFHRQHAHHFVNNRSWAARFVHVFEEIHQLGHWRELRLSMAISGLYWVGQVVAIWAIARADAFEGLTLMDITFLLVVKSVGTLIPNAPANMGAYQASIIYALGLLLTEKPQAQILAQIIFSFMTLPPLLCGAAALAFAGFNLSDLRRHAHHAHSTRRMKPKPADGPADNSGSPPR